MNCGIFEARYDEPLTIGGGAYWRPAHLLSDVNFFFLYIAIMTGENLQ